MNLYYGISAALFGVAIVVAQPQVVAALTAQEVNTIARDITVLIDGLYPGSGVIVAREGNRYYVLTAEHVVEVEDEYEAVTPDGKRYPIDYSKIQKLPEVDLAVVQFTSEQNYRVATLADYDLRTRGRGNQLGLVFVSGWPLPGQVIPEKIRLFTPGLRVGEDIAPALAKESISEGYELFYTSITYPGMSGGPVLDSSGRVIGIHGRAEGEEISETESGTDEYRVKFGYSIGVPINTFLRLVRQAEIQDKLTVEKFAPAKLTLQEAGSIEALLTAVPGSDDPREWVNRGNQLWRLASVYDYYGNSKALELREEALAAYEQAVKKAPHFYQAWYARGNVLSELGRYEDAVGSYDSAIQLFPYEKVSQNYSDASQSNDRGTQRRLQSDLEFYATFWRYRGLMLANLKRYSEALESFDRAMQLHLDDSVNWDLRGVALQGLNRHAEALASFDKAIEFKPDYQYAWMHRGNALSALGKYEEAVASYDRAIQIQHNFYQAWVKRGAVLSDFLKRHAEGIASLDRAIQIKPDDPYAWHRRGFALFGLKRHAEAIACFDKAIEINPNDAAAWSARGLALIVLDRYKEALEAFEKAQAISPNNPDAQKVRSLLQQLGR